VFFLKKKKIINISIQYDSWESLVDTILSYLMLLFPFISFNLLGRGESRTVQIAESIGLYCYVTKLFYIFIFIRICFIIYTRTVADPIPYHYYLLWEPFINNLVQYISNDHPVVFMLFGSKAVTVRKSINEIKSSVVEVPHPIYEYNEFKNSKCFCKARELACELGFTIEW